MSNFFLILLALTLFLMPLHSVITAEKVLTISLLIFYTHQLFSSSPEFKNKKILFYCFILNLFLFFISFISLYRPFNFYEIYRWILIIWTVPFFKFCIDRYGTKKVILISVTVVALHASWGITQFILQHDLGFNILGESVLSPAEPGVAKFLFNNQKIIRAYGPYPHPNIFSSALLIGLIILISRFNPADGGVNDLHKKIFLFFGTILFLGLMATFSRSALLGTLIIILAMILKKTGRGVEQKKIFLIIFIITILFSPLLFSRGTDPQDKSFSERKSGIEWSVKIIRPLPWWRGVGVGKYEVALQDYLKKNTIVHQPWEIQPIHSVPFLIAAEWGKSIALLLSVAYVLFMTRAIKQKKNDLFILLLAVTPALLLDHYFLTQTSPLLWMVLAILLLHQKGKEMAMIAPEA